jgi:hypothetical protein
MTPLSPAARAVLDALPGAPHLQMVNRAYAAAVLRAAADRARQILEEMSSPSNDWGEGWKQGGIDMAQGLLAIAAELEGANG